MICWGAPRKCFLVNLWITKNSIVNTLKWSKGSASSGTNSGEDFSPFSPPRSALLAAEFKNRLTSLTVILVA